MMNKCLDKRVIGHLLGMPIVVAVSPNKITKNELYASSDEFGYIKIYKRDSSGYLCPIDIQLCNN